MTETTSAGLGRWVRNVLMRVLLGVVGVQRGWAAVHGKKRSLNRTFCTRGLNRRRGVGFPLTDCRPAAQTARRHRRASHERRRNAVAVIALSSVPTEKVRIAVSYSASTRTRSTEQRPES